MSRRLLPFAALLVISGCAAAPEPESGPAPTGQESVHAVPSTGEATGTLRQDQFTIPLQVGDVQLRVTPLDEEVLRLAAPDTYRRLLSLRVEAQKRTEAELGIPAPTLFLVTFSSSETGESFEPTHLTVEAGGRSHRAQRIIPLTTGWGEQRLSGREAQTAVYLFESRIDPFQPFTIRYGADATERWQSIIPFLHREQARVRRKLE